MSSYHSLNDQEMGSSDTDKVEKEIESLHNKLQDLSRQNEQLQLQSAQISRLENEIRALNLSAQEADFESSLIRSHLSQLHLDYSNAMKSLIACQEKLEHYIILARQRDMALRRSRKLLTRFYAASSRLACIVSRA